MIAKPLALAAVASLFLAAPGAESAFAHKKVVFKNVHKKVVHKTVVRTFPRSGGIHFSVGWTPAVSYTFVVRRVHVPAVTRRVVIGYDSCGRPLYDVVVIRPACYRLARFKVYASGAEVFVGYVG